MGSHSRWASAETGGKTSSWSRPPEQADELEALREENGRLRELVVRLSTLVIKSVIDRK
jgi:hypothetical protein